MNKTSSISLAFNTETCTCKQDYDKQNTPELDPWAPRMRWPSGTTTPNCTGTRVYCCCCVWPTASVVCPQTHSRLSYRRRTRALPARCRRPAPRRAMDTWVLVPPAPHPMELHTHEEKTIFNLTVSYWVYTLVQNFYSIHKRSIHRPLQNRENAIIDSSGWVIYPENINMKRKISKALCIMRENVFETNSPSIRHSFLNFIKLDLLTRSLVLFIMWNSQKVSVFLNQRLMKF